MVICALTEVTDTDVNIKDLIEVDPEKMSGTACFIGTRVPLTHLFDYLESGDTLDDFLKDFPSVTRDHALGVLELMKSESSQSMKLLLDECVPQRLRDDFPDHDVYTAETAELLGVKNGALLRAAAAQISFIISLTSATGRISIVPYFMPGCCDRR